MTTFYVENARKNRFSFFILIFQVFFIAFFQVFLILFKIKKQVLKPKKTFFFLLYICTKRHKNLPFFVFRKVS
jgi:hypothetical protein